MDERNGREKKANVADKHNYEKIYKKKESEK